MAVKWVLNPGPAQALLSYEAKPQAVRGGGVRHFQRPTTQRMEALALHPWGPHLYPNFCLWGGAGIPTQDQPQARGEGAGTLRES